MSSPQRKWQAEKQQQSHSRAAQEQAESLLKANAALQETIDVLASIHDVNDFVPLVLQVVGRAFDACYWVSLTRLFTALTCSAAKSIQFMFNTFHPERLQEAVGDERCSLGMPFVQAMLDGDVRLKATIGAGGQKTIMSQQRWVDVFNAAGLPAALEPDMPLWLRCHVPMCVAFESVSVAGERRGGGASWKEALILARGVHASYKLITRLGYPVYPKAKQRINDRPTWALAAMLWFMSRVRPFRRLLATGEAECCALVDSIVAAASLAKLTDVVSDIQAMRPA